MELNKLTEKIVFLGKRLLRVSFLFFVLSAAFYLRREDYKTSELRVYPNPVAKYFTFGYEYAVADAIWIKVLLNLDYCESNLSPTYNAGLNLKEILSENLSKSRCHMGWLYQWMNLASDLDPKFRAIYSSGATSLSILVDDREGARQLFNKGLKRFPKDWVLNYRAAYHYLYEMQEAERAAELMMVSYKNGGPDFLPALAAQLYSGVGKAEFAKVFLQEFIEENPDSIHIDQIRKRLQELQ